MRIITRKKKKKQEIVFNLQEIPDGGYITKEGYIVHKNKNGDIRIAKLSQKKQKPKKNKGIAPNKIGGLKFGNDIWSIGFDREEDKYYIESDWNPFRTCFTEDEFDLLISCVEDIRGYKKYND